MKKVAITLSMLAGATFGYAQGTINWTDYAPASGSLPAFSISVFAPGTETPGTGANPNNTVNDLPAGTATYTGAALSTGTYTMGIYLDTSAVTVAADVLSGSPAATDAFGGSAGFAGKWDVSGGLITTFSAASGPLAAGSADFVDLAAWNNAGGTLTSYAAAAAAPGGQFGSSGASTGSTTLGGAGSPPALPGTLAGIGLQSFELGTTTTPEPSTIALGIVGASTFLMRLRRKQ